MQGLNLTTFFAYVRKAPFGGRLTQSQIDGMNDIMQAFDDARIGITGAVAMKFLAYMLATAFHETGGKMQPVREGFAKNDAGARKKVAGRAYAAVDSVTGQVYYGRGLVQLTWAKNYKTMGDILGVDLYNKPDLALDPLNSARILVEGMTQGASGKGDYTGKCLEDYFGGDKEDAIGARRIINGTDKCILISQYYENFVDALRHADNITTPRDVDPADAEPDKPSLSTDTTTIGAITGIAGSGAVGALSSINSPWAFAAFAVLALGAFLFLTGRLSIRKKGGA